MPYFYDNFDDKNRITQVSPIFAKHVVLVFVAVWAMRKVENFTSSLGHGKNKSTVINNNGKTENIFLTFYPLKCKIS